MELRCVNYCFLYVPLPITLSLQVYSRYDCTSALTFTNTAVPTCTCLNERRKKEERKKQARSNKQTRQSNTAHPRQSLFLRKMSCLGWDSNPRHSTLCLECSTTELPRQLSWLGPNVTSHSTPDEQANHQLSMYM